MILLQFCHSQRPNTALTGHQVVPITVVCYLQRQSASRDGVGYLDPRWQTRRRERAVPWKDVTCACQAHRAKDAREQRDLPILAAGLRSSSRLACILSMATQNQFPTTVVDDIEIVTGFFAQRA